MPYEPVREPVLIVVNNGFERRYYFSANQAADGTGYLLWNREDVTAMPGGELQVYRLDEAATDALMEAVHGQHVAFEGQNAEFAERKPVYARLMTAITGIKLKATRR